MKFICTIFLLLLCVVKLNAQAGQFSLSGKVDLPTGTIVLVPAYDSLLYPADNHRYEAQIKNGTFTFKGDIKYPIPMILGIKEGDKLRYRTTRFFLDKGEQTADWHTNPSQSTDAHVSNAPMKEQQEYDGLLSNAVYQIHQLTVALNGMDDNEANAKIKEGLLRQQEEWKSRKDSIVLHYAKTHPASFIPLWDVVRLLDIGYTPFLDSFEKAMPENIRYTFTGHQLAVTAGKLKLTIKGSTLPLLPLTDMNGNRRNINLSETGKKYILLDFWYSSCYPCMRLFPGYKKLYDAYRDKGFEIVAISIDEGKYVDACKKMIAEKQLNWQQYLDNDKRVVQMLHILRYPTSFLLDSEGKIIAHDVRPAELEEFLKNNLGQ